MPLVEKKNENAKENTMIKKTRNTANSTPAGYSKKIPLYTNAVSTFIIYLKKSPQKNRQYRRAVTTKNHPRRSALESCD